MPVHNYSVKYYYIIVINSMIWLRYERIVRDAACNFMDYPLDFLVFFYWLDSAWVVISSSGSRKTSCERWSEYGWLAQLAEHLTLNQGVRGSNPRGCTKTFLSELLLLQTRIRDCSMVRLGETEAVIRTAFFFFCKVICLYTYFGLYSIMVYRSIYWIKVI